MKFISEYYDKKKDTSGLFGFFKKKLASNPVPRGSIVGGNPNLGDIDNDLSGGISYQQ